MVTIETFERVLSAHRFFEGLAPAYLETVVGCAANVTFEPGEFIFREESPADRFYVLRHGKVSVEIFVPGRGAITVETLEAGDVLGWSWLFPPYQSRFDARALTPVRALSLDGACLRGKCEKDAALGYELMKRFTQLITQRLEATRMQLLDLYGSRA
jgi:CRP-like cAMP-binding protein